MSNFDKIKKTIANLLNMTVENGATLEESLTAINIAKKLSEKHGLSIEDIKKENFIEEDFITIAIQTNTKQIHVIDRFVSRRLGKMFSVKVWLCSNITGNNIQLFGHKMDVEITKTLRNILIEAVENDYNKFKMSNSFSQHWKTVRKSFFMGFVSAVIEKIEKMKLEGEHQTTSNELIILKDQLVEDKFKQMLNIRIEKNNKKYKYYSNNKSFEAGFKSGEKVNLSY